MEKIFGASEPGHSPLNGLGGPTMPRLNRILADIRRGADADDALRDYVEVEARDLTGERLTRFMNEVYGRVHGLIQRCAVALLIALGAPHVHPNHACTSASRASQCRRACGAHWFTYRTA